MMQLKVNGQTLSLDVDPNMPLLYALRDVAHLTGTKFGCGMGLCGACTVHLNGVPVRSCITPVSAVVDKQVTTIEGLAEPGKLHPLQQAWVEHKVAQCGYCQCGQIMSAAALLEQTPKPSETEIENYMQGNICRCGTYPRIKQAIQTAAVMIQEVTTAKGGA
jgi:isoquinoline 1-oxidoreductase alpha subunit